MPLVDAGVDWSRTVAWGEGGYYARVFLNVHGREPGGIVDPSDYDSVRADLAARLAAIPDPDGGPLATSVFTPEELYEDPKGVPPDLIVHFGDLHWRSVGTVGGEEAVHTFRNDTGPDEANHAQDGLFIMHGRGIPGQGVPESLSLLDIAPTTLALLGVDIPRSMRGQSLVG
jgi:predicted AlkP superfamily phosphohydrolase/phosphomutase